MKILRPGDAIDRAKCANEIHQYQQQQFTLTTAALTFFGAFFIIFTVPGRLNVPPATLPATVPATAPVNMTMFIPPLASLILLGLLLTLFKWIMHMRKTVLVISTWMELTGGQWESDARKFSNKTPGMTISSTLFAAKVYCCLGAATLALVVLVGFTSGGMGARYGWCVFGATAAVWAWFCGYVYWNGIKYPRKPTADDMKNKWAEVWPDADPPVSSGKG